MTRKCSSRPMPGATNYWGSGDLGDKADEATIRAKMASLMTEAKSQILHEHD